MSNDNEWVYEDDHAYQLACERPDPQDGFDADDEAAYLTGEAFEDDGQPSEYEEWQDLYGGDDYFDDRGEYEWDA